MARKVQDEESIVWQQVRRGEHPVAMLLTAAAAGHAPGENDLDYVVALAHGDKRPAVRRRLVDTITECHRLRNVGRLAQCRRLARDTQYELVPVMHEYRPKGSGLFEHEGQSPAELASLIRRQ